MQTQSLQPLSDALLQTLKKIPNNSGVYHYFDGNGRLLYVGKAKNLKNRTKFKPKNCANDKSSRTTALYCRRK